jgi:hypothetical protein
MPDSPQHDFKTTELDPHLPSTPFRVQANWHVITGVHFNLCSPQQAQDTQGRLCNPAWEQDHPDPITMLF